MKKVFLFIIIIVLNVITVAGCLEEENKMSESYSLEGKKIVMIIASQNFRDEEYQQPKDILTKHGAQIIVASSSLKKAKGVLGLEIQPDKLLSDVKAEDYDAIIFVGGNGAREYYNSKSAHSLIKDAFKLNKIIGAICIAPVILAKAGVLSGKKATVFSSEITQIRNLGTNYTGKAVQIDGNIITANGHDAGKEFGTAILEALQ